MVGRFISPDPIGFAGGLNLYGYCDGNPVGCIDPTGLGWKKTTLTIGGGIIGGLLGLPEGGIGAGPGAIAGAGFGRYLGGRLEGESIPQAAKATAIQVAVDVATVKTGTVIKGALAARRAKQAAELGACQQQVATSLTQVLLQRAGFSESGVPLIVDTSLGASSTAVATALRAKGYNARSVLEVFGTGRVDDIDILNLAKNLGGRVIAADKGHDFLGGFERLTIKIPNRLRNVDSVIRLFESRFKR